MGATKDTPPPGLGVQWGAAGALSSAIENGTTLKTVPRRLGAIAALALALPPLLTIPQASAEPIDAVDAASARQAFEAVTAYFDSTESEYTNGSAKQRSAAATDPSEGYVAQMRFSITSEGFEITDTQVETEGLGIIQYIDKATKDYISANNVTTTWTLKETSTNEVSDASMSVIHHVRSKPIGGNTTVLSDQVFTDAAEDQSVEPVTTSDLDISSDNRADATPGGAVKTLGSSSTSGTVTTRASYSYAVNLVAMKNYAMLWTDSSHKKQLNPAYPDTDNNCANFASQALKAGGMAYQQGSGRAALITWTPNLTGPFGPSYTWSKSGYLHDRLVQLGQKKKLKTVWDGNVGDLLMADWNTSGVKVDKILDHTMIVTGRSKSGVPRISQKSGNQHNILLTTSITNAKAQGATKIVWYGIRI